MRLSSGRDYMKRASSRTGTSSGDSPRAGMIPRDKRSKTHFAEAAKDVDAEPHVSSWRLDREWRVERPRGAVGASSIDCFFVAEPCKYAMQSGPERIKILQFSRSAAHHLFVFKEVPLRASERRGPAPDTSRKLEVDRPYLFIGIKKISASCNRANTSPRREATQRSQPSAGHQNALLNRKLSIFQDLINVLPINEFNDQICVSILIKKIEGSRGGNDTLKRFEGAKFISHSMNTISSIDTDIAVK